MTKEKKVVAETK
jgi:hypothetical protein